MGIVLLDVQDGRSEDFANLPQRGGWCRFPGSAKITIHGNFLNLSPKTLNISWKMILHVISFLLKTKPFVSLFPQAPVVSLSSVLFFEWWSYIPIASFLQTYIENSILISFNSSILRLLPKNPQTSNPCPPTRLHFVIHREFSYYINWISYLLPSPPLLLRLP